MKIYVTSRAHTRHNTALHAIGLTVRMLVHLDSVLLAPHLCGETFATVLAHELVRRLIKIRVHGARYKAYTRGDGGLCRRAVK